MKTCSICPLKHLAKGYCCKHYTRLRNNGDVNSSSRKRKHDKQVRIEGEVAFIELTQGNEAIVDVNDLPRLRQFSWYASGGYARTTLPDGKKLLMHSFLTGFSITDHINQNSLDNRSCNLRPASKSQNGMNAGSKGGSSKYKGVFWCKRTEKWNAELWKNRRKHLLGSHDSEEKAAIAYNKAAKRLHGEFASLNVLPNRKESTEEDFAPFRP